MKGQSYKAHCLLLKSKEDMYLNGSKSHIEQNRLKHRQNFRLFIYSNQWRKSRGCQLLVTRKTVVKLSFKTSQYILVTNISRNLYNMYLADEATTN